MTVRAADIEPPEDEPVDKVTAWRHSEFVRLGFSEDDSLLMASTGVDLHVAERMLRNGCSSYLAKQILT